MDARKIAQWLIEMHGFHGAKLRAKRPDILEEIERQLFESTATPESSEKPEFGQPINYPRNHVSRAVI